MHVFITITITSLFFFFFCISRTSFHNLLHTSTSCMMCVCAMLPWSFISFLLVLCFYSYSFTLIQSPFNHLNIPPNFLQLIYLSHTYHIVVIVLTFSSHRFKIEDANYSKDELAAWACIRLDRLQQGYRLIPLKDIKGNSTEGLLLVKIEKILS